MTEAYQDQIYPGVPVVGTPNTPASSFDPVSPSLELVPPVALSPFEKAIYDPEDPIEPITEGEIRDISKDNSGDDVSIHYTTTLLLRLSGDNFRLEHYNFFKIRRAYLNKVSGMAKTNAETRQTAVIEYERAKRSGEPYAEVLGIVRGYYGKLQEQIASLSTTDQRAEFLDELYDLTDEVDHIGLDYVQQPSYALGRPNRIIAERLLRFILKDKFELHS